MDGIRSFTAFAGHHCIGSGSLTETVLLTKAHVDTRGWEGVLVFEDGTGNQIDFDLSGTADEVVEKLAAHPLAEADPPKRAGPGRPKLGVLSREVSLLPRHWEWLEAQRGGISVALRALVDEARKRGQSAILARNARDAAGKFMWTMAGNLPGFEEASRALYAKDDEKLFALVRGWPGDIEQHVRRLVDDARRFDELARAEATKAG